jgi:hypothetical protein
MKDIEIVAFIKVSLEAVVFLETVVSFKAHYTQRDISANNLTE